MIAFLRFEGRRIFAEKKNLVFLGFISLLAAYFTWSGLNEFRQFQKEKEAFLRFEKEKVSQLVTYAQYGGFGFRLLYEASPLGLFFINSSVFQDLESNIDNFEAIRVESSFKGKKLFLKRGYFKDFAGILLAFGSLLMLYLGQQALVGPAYIRFMSRCMSLREFYARTTLARLVWLDLFFLALGAGLFFLVRIAGMPFSREETLIFALFLVFLLAMLDFFYLLGQFTVVIVRFRPVYFLWLFIVWFLCVFLLPEVNRIRVFNRSQGLESAEKVNLEKFRVLMDLEKELRDYLKANPDMPRDQIRSIQKKFAVQFINSSYLVNTALETRYLREVEQVIASHERHSVFFPTTCFQFIAGEVSGKGYYGYLDFMDYIMTLRNRFIQFYLQKRYEQPDSPIESFVKSDENIFRARSRLPRSFRFEIWLTILYGVILFFLGFWLLQRRGRRS